MNMIRKISIAILTLTSAASCDSFLETNPDNRVELDSPEKAAQLLTSAYSNGAYTFTEWMGDNVTYTTGTTILTEHIQSYMWDEITSINQDTPANFWTTTYEAIAAANEVLAVIDELPGDRDLKKAVAGEAYLTRAYGHFMLVSLFSKHYDPETADEDPGIPYVTEPETEFVKKYTRGTVEEVFEKVEADLMEGLDLVDPSYYANSGKYHFNREAALAFASRFYLFKGDLDNCIKYSSELLDSDPYLYIKDIRELLDQTANADAFIKEYSDPTDASNLLVCRQITNFPVNVGYWPSPNMISSFYGSNPWDENDVRVDQQYPIYLRGSGWTLAKNEFLFERSSLTSNVGLYYTIASLFRGEEVLLNRAECYALQNKLNLAVADLQVLVDMRYENEPTVTLTALKNYYGISNNFQATFTYIIEERRKEFIHEGLRWFDIKRFNLPVSHFMPGGTLQLTSEDLRKIMQIPQAAIDVAGLTPNPR
ncbi:MAG TPA: RagB/SusD family nutrient uptake outer membrane protein [Ohtaekwangia sp.]